MNILTEVKSTTRHSIEMLLRAEAKYEWRNKTLFKNERSY
jgi:hypothetical protein